MSRFVRRALLLGVALTLGLATFSRLTYVRARDEIESTIDEAERRSRDVDLIPRGPLVGVGTTPRDGAAEYEGILSDGLSEPLSQVIWVKHEPWTPEREVQRVPLSPYGERVVTRLVEIARLRVSKRDASNGPRPEVASARARDLARDLASACFWVGTPRSEILRLATASLVLDHDWALAGSGSCSSYYNDDAATRAVCAIGWAMDHGAYDAQALETVGPVLEALAATPTSTRGIEFGCAATIAGVAGWRAPDPTHLHGGKLTDWRPRKYAEGEFDWTDVIYAGDALRTLRSVATELVDAWRTPSARLDSVLRDRVEWVRDDTNPFEVQARIELVQRAGDRLAWAIQWSLVRTAVAWARFVADRNSSPPSIEALAPRYLSSVPIDPMTGHPVRAENGRVWCVGEDGDDDGGSPSVSYGSVGPWIFAEKLRPARDPVPDGDCVRRLAAPDRAHGPREVSLATIAGMYTAFGGIRAIGMDSLSPRTRDRGTIESAMFKFVSIGPDGELIASRTADFGGETESIGRVVTPPDAAAADVGPRRWTVIHDEVRLGLRDPNGEETWLEPIPAPSPPAPK